MLLPLCSTDGIGYCFGDAPSQNYYFKLLQNYPCLVSKDHNTFSLKFWRFLSHKEHNQHYLEMSNSFCHSIGSIYIQYMLPWIFSAFLLTDTFVHNMILI